MQTRPFVFGGFCCFLAYNSSIFHKRTPLCSLLQCRNMFNLHVMRSRAVWVLSSEGHWTGFFHFFVVPAQFSLSSGWDMKENRSDVWNVAFFTPLKFRITSGCQRVTLSKSFTTENIVYASATLFFLSWKRTHSERGWPPRPDTLNWGAVGKQSYENHSYFHLSYFQALG